MSMSHRMAISKALTGKVQSSETIEKRRASMLGRKKTLDHRIKIGLSNKGSRSARWKGGITKLNTALRNTIEYRDWRRRVFERDHFTCQMCGQIGGKLNADHIKSFALYPEHRFNLSNGRTLCIECHKRTDTYAGKAIYLKPCPSPQ